MSEPHPSSAGPMKIGNWTHQTAPETDSSLSSLFSHHNRQCQKEEKRGRSGSGSRCGSAERCDLLSFLRDLRIHPDLALSYCNMMRDNGYDDVLAVRDAEEVELRELGIKVGHVRRMRRAAQGECTGGASPPSRTISPPPPAAARHRPHSIEGGGGNPPPLLCPDDESVGDLSVSVRSVERAKRRIAMQARRIRLLEEQLALASSPEGPLSLGGDGCRRESGIAVGRERHCGDEQRRQRNASTTQGGDIGVVAGVVKPLTKEERLQAHKERKMLENKYKEKSGKWDRPPSLAQESLTIKVAKKDDFVERLASNRTDRRKHDEIKRKVDRTLNDYANATPEKLEKRKNGSAIKKSVQNNTALKSQQLMFENEKISPNAKNLSSPRYARSASSLGEYHELALANGQDFYNPKRGSNQCETCGSRGDCEEDADDPGAFYCKKCWEEYETPEDTASPVVKNIGLSAAHKVTQPSPISNMQPIPKNEASEASLALWIVHDNPQLGNLIVASGSRSMKCLVETKETESRSCVRIVTGTIDYSGRVIGSGLNRGSIESTELGTECIRLRGVKGYFVDHNTVETRLSQDGDILEFCLGSAKSAFLSGEDASMSAKEFLCCCNGAVDVIIDPQKSTGDWYPLKEVASGRKIAPQFRSKGVGYIRLGDDMGKNGLAFISSDSCRTFLSTFASLSSVSTPPTIDDKLKQTTGAVKPLTEVKDKPASKIKSGRNAGNKLCATKQRNSRLRQLALSEESDPEEECATLLGAAESDSDSSEDDSDDAGELLKQLQNTSEIKWQEKKDLIERLGKSVARKNKFNDGFPHSGTALNIIQDIIGSKNVNVHVLKSAIAAVEKIGYHLGANLVAEISWRTILVEMLRLLKNRQVCNVTRKALQNLHGQCFTLANCFQVVSHVLGLGKDGSGVASGGGGGKGGGLKRRSSTSMVTSGSDKAAGGPNNVVVIEWLAQLIEVERNAGVGKSGNEKTFVGPAMDFSGITTLSNFFLGHASHRDPKCRKNALDGLLHCIIYGIVRLGLKVTDAQDICADLKISNPRSWRTLIETVHRVLEEERVVGKKKTS